jgi:hypothetical protein
MRISSYLEVVQSLRLIRAAEIIDVSPQMNGQEAERTK